MNYKIEGAINKSRKYFIICGILWLILVFVFVLPSTYSWVQSTQDTKFSLNDFLTTFPTNVTHPFSSIVGLVKVGKIGSFFKSLLIFSILYLVLFVIGVIRSAPNNEFSDIEHGSSDWCKHGEQYKILSKNKGIVLAEDNYLPLDKRGNVNVLVVGRIWCW